MFAGVLTCQCKVLCIHFHGRHSRVISPVMKVDAQYSDVVLYDLFFVSFIFCRLRRITAQAVFLAWVDCVNRRPPSQVTVPHIQFHFRLCVKNALCCPCSVEVLKGNSCLFLCACQASLAARIFSIASPWVSLQAVSRNRVPFW